MASVGAPIDAFVSSLPDWLSWLSGFLVALAWLFVLLLGAWLAVLVTSLAGGPLFAELAARIEAEVSGARPRGDEGIAAAIAASFRRELAKAAYHLPRLVLLLLLAIVPGVGAIAAPLTFLFSAWMLALQFADLVFENHALPFRETRAVLRARFGPAFGYGIPCTLMMSVPLVNLLLMPAAAAGGVLLALELRTGAQARRAAL